MRLESSLLPVGNTEWCMYQMKLIELYQECKSKCKEKFSEKEVSKNQCSICLFPLSYDSCNSSMICKRCGLSIYVLVEQENDYSTFSTHNGNKRHNYDPSEHFSQTLCDFCGIGNRKTPQRIVKHCELILGNGLHVTSDKVFKVLQRGGFRSYYQHKYEIANRLRGKPEFHISNQEIEHMRTIYARYRREFIPFQERYLLSQYSIRGKPRIFWPMRFIFKQICIEIGRPDLVKYIRDIRDPKGNKRYQKYWNLLKNAIDTSRPLPDLSDRSQFVFPLSG